MFSGVVSSSAVNISDHGKLSWRIARFIAEIESEETAKVLGSRVGRIAPPFWTEEATSIWRLMRVSSIDVSFQLIVANEAPAAMKKIADRSETRARWFGLNNPAKFIGNEFMTSAIERRTYQCGPIATFQIMAFVVVWNENLVINVFRIF